MSADQIWAILQDARWPGLEKTYDKASIVLEGCDVFAPPGQAGDASQPQSRRARHLASSPTVTKVMAIVCPVSRVRS